MIWVGKDIKNQVANPCNGQEHLPLSQVASNMALNNSRNETSGISLLPAPHQHQDLRKNQEYTHIWIDIIKKIDFI